MRKIFNWIILFFIVMFVIFVIENIRTDSFNGGHLFFIACIGGLAYWLFNRICDDRGIREAFSFRKTATPMPIVKMDLICPNDARAAVEFLADLVVTIDRLMSYIPKSNFSKISLSIWQNDDYKAATLKFWYDTDRSTMKNELLEHFNLEDKFSFNDDGWIKYNSEQIINFTPEWVNETNAERVIADTFLNRCSYARILDASCSKNDGKVSCFFTFGF